MDFSLLWTFHHGSLLVQLWRSWGKAILCQPELFINHHWERLFMLLLLCELKKGVLKENLLAFSSVPLFPTMVFLEVISSSSLFRKGLPLSYRGRQELSLKPFLFSGSPFWRGKGSERGTWRVKWASALSPSWSVHLLHRGKSDWQFNEEALKKRGQNKYRRLFLWGFFFMQKERSALEVCPHFCLASREADYSAQLSL